MKSIPPRPLPAALLLLLAATPAARAQFVVTGLTPLANAVAAPRTTNVDVSFSATVNNNATTLQALKVFSAQRGGRLQTGAGGTTTRSGTGVLRFVPTTNFRPGETVFVTVTTQAQHATGAALAAPYVAQFTTAAGGTGEGRFDAAALVPVGTQTRSVVAADVDSDGDLDLLAANAAESTVSVRLNNGTGTFSGTQDVAVGIDPWQVAVGDVDGDGDLDLVTVNQSANTLSVRLNNGSGTFSGTQEVAVGGSPRSLALGDVDGDGDLDLLTANYFAASASVRLNNGTGTFGSPQEVGTSFRPNTVALGDVDGDGDLDMVLGSNPSTLVAVRLNNGTGSFGGGSNLLLPFGANAVALGDVDGDGDLDLAAASYDAGGVYVRLNNGTGTFSGTRLVPTGAGTFGVSLADVDGDGDLDLAAASYDTGGVYVRLNDGTGLFSGTQQLPSPGGPVYSTALADLDGDGDLDLLVAAANGQLGRYLNQPLAPLPVALTAFAATAEGAAVVLAWHTASELHCARFVVERSADGRAFAPVGRVAGQGTTARPTAYAYRDAAPTPAGALYYRLRQEDEDGTAHYSPVRVVRLGGAGALTLYPNPARTAVAVAGLAAGARVQVRDALGREVAAAAADATGTARLGLPTGLAAGVYVVQSGAQVRRLAVE